MTDTLSAVVILVAGMPRSGSTWQFNAARLLLEDSGLPHWAGWIADRPPPGSSPIHLIKVHSTNDAPPSPNLVLTTWRPLEDCLRSRVRMGWLAADRTAVRNAFEIQQKLYIQWHARSDLETAHDDILRQPLAEVGRIEACLGQVLGLPRDPGRASRVASRLAAMVPPDTQGSAGRYDPKTLLHPGHRRGDTETAPEAVPDLGAWLEGLGQNRIQPRTRS